MQWSTRVTRISILLFHHLSSGSRNAWENQGTRSPTSELENSTKWWALPWTPRISVSPWPPVTKQLSTVASWVKENHCHIQNLHNHKRLGGINSKCTIVMYTVPTGIHNKIYPDLSSLHCLQVRLRSLPLSHTIGLQQDPHPPPYLLTTPSSEAWKNLVSNTSLEIQLWAIQWTKKVVARQCPTAIIPWKYFFFPINLLPSHEIPLLWICRTEGYSCIVNFQFVLVLCTALDA